MTVRELSRYYNLRKYVDQLEREIKTLEVNALSAVNLDPMPKGRGGVNRASEDTALSLAKLKRTVARERAKAMREYVKLDAYISTIPDITVKRIFRYRYCECLKWEEVARSMGPGYTMEAVKKRHYRYIKGEKRGG